MLSNDIKINFDIERYLRQKEISFHMVGSNAMLCCPFHKETNPSFGIDIQTGLYHCFSGSCGVKGNLVKFIQKVEGMSTYEEAELWLRSRYGISPDNTDKSLELVFGDEKKKDRIIYIDEDFLKQYDFRHPYLQGRGIPDMWQRRFRVGYDSEIDFITIPWFDHHGRCVGIKKRSVFGKEFRVFKLSDIGPNKITLFGINHVYRRKERRVVITEAEIDAMYCWANGIPAIALGTSHITNNQLQELKNTYVESVIIATDNDDAGRKIASELWQKLDWINDMRQVNWGLYPNIKDVNQLCQNGLQLLTENANWGLAT